MSTAPGSSTAPGAAGRRVRFGLKSLVLLASVTASCLFIGLIASRYPVRLDATATREHLLSPRTLSTLGGLDGPYEIIVAANRSTVDQRAYERTRDVLDSFARASDRVAVTFIDTGSSSGIGAYDALLKRLSERYGAQIAANRARVDEALGTAQAQQEAIVALAEKLAMAKETARGADTKSEQLRQLLDDYTARSRVAAFNLDQTVSGATKALSQPIGPPALGLAPLDDVSVQISKSIGTVTSDLSRLHRELRLFEQASDIPGAVKDQVRPLAPTAQSAMEKLRGAADSMDLLPRLPIFAVARTLEKTSAALVIGPPRPSAGSGAAGPGSITAIDFASLFPPALPAGAAPGITIDRRARAEELTATAIASLGSASPPIVVLVHDQPTRLAPTFEAFAAMLDRLGLRRMDVVEWATALDAQEPPLAGVPGSSTRPVVYVTQTTSPSTQDAADRMKKMSAALGRLVSQGKAVLMSVNVSTLPGIGASDPLVEFLEPLGIKVDSGRPLMQRVQSPSGPVVLTDLLPNRAAVGEGGDHPISRAIDGLAMHFFWAVPVQHVMKSESGASAASFTPIVRIENDGSTWAESEWLGYARVPANQRKKVIDPPLPDSPRDDAKGPWPIVVAAERAGGTGSAGVPRVQRLVVVGCSGWFLDSVTQQSVGVIDGRPVLSSPGNLELLEASVLWLAGQDELIARSPTAQAVPTIRSLTGRQVQAVRWSLLAGLPAVVLLIGAAWRLVRG
ncbi:MAG: hypothetical protein AB7G11_01260 [Phycisphaerales bacterium]